ncbi:TPA: YopX family protein [Streptococcus suis]
MIPRYRVAYKNKILGEVGAIDFIDETVEIPVYDSETGEYLVSYELGLNQVILMQSTGLFDKNGKEVFEGDVVKLRYTISSDYEFFKVTRLRGGSWRIDNRRRGCELWLRNEDCEVIGNIYENSELVEG